MGRLHPSALNLSIKFPLAARRQHLHAQRGCQRVWQHHYPVFTAFGFTRVDDRTAISNERLRTINTEEVAYTVRANDRGGKRLQRLEGAEFVRRFLLHVLPTGIKRIRHYGVLASSCKGAKLNAARVAKMDVGLCPCCKVGRLQVTAVLQGQARLPAPSGSVLPPGRGPPA